MTSDGRVFGPPAAKKTGKHGALAIELLQIHEQDGRLTAHELMTRAQQVSEARTLGDLDALFADLPILAGGVTPGVTTLGFAEALRTVQERYDAP